MYLSCPSNLIPRTFYVYILLLRNLHLKSLLEWIAQEYGLSTLSTIRYLDEL